MTSNVFWLEGCGLLWGCGPRGFTGGEGRQGEVEMAEEKGPSRLVGVQSPAETL